jgi:hypothetical protein
LPFITLTHSPAFCQLLLPAESTPKVLGEFLDLVDEHFGKVRGKLPLHISLRVVNRRFPLPVLPPRQNRPGMIVNLPRLT